MKWNLAERGRQLYSFEHLVLFLEAQRAPAWFFLMMGVFVWTCAAALVLCWFASMWTAVMAEAPNGKRAEQRQWQQVTLKGKIDIPPVCLFLQAYKEWPNASVWATAGMWSASACHPTTTSFHFRLLSRGGCWHIALKLDLQRKDTCWGS